MAKIMLVEDDNSLREIYEARLVAEGYSVVSAKDGEEALALALKERPDLIIADIMMPKVSGFDMLDILRSTPETKNTKIMMMTALSQAEDKARAEKLGADRYLVKSQVTLEDVTREARTILDELESQAAATVAKIEAAPTPTVTPTPAPAPVPVTPAPTPAPVAPAPTPPPPELKTTVTTIPVSAPDDGDDDSGDDTTPVDPGLEKAAEALSTPVKTEKAEINEQVDDFIAANPTLSNSPDAKTDSNARATKAVDSLTKPINAKSSVERKDSADASQDKADRAYVATAENDQKPNGSLSHTKTISPTSDSSAQNIKPSINELLAKEGESLDSVTSPNISGIISPTN